MRYLLWFGVVVRQAAAVHLEGAPAAEARSAPLDAETFSSCGAWRPLARCCDRRIGVWPHPHQHMPGLLVPQAQVVTAQAELDWVPKRSSADHLDADAITEAHLQEPSAELALAANAYDPRQAATLEAVHRAGGTPRTVCARQVEGGLHQQGKEHPPCPWRRLPASRNRHCSRTAET